MIAAKRTGIGTDVVLLHGVGLDRAMWRRCVPALAARHRVTLLDLPGHGGSAPVPPGTDLPGLAAAVAGALPGPSHVVGFSLGALVAQELALRSPASVRSLTLVSAVADRTPEQAAAVRARLELTRRDPAATARAAVDRWFDDAWRKAEPELAEEILQTLLATDRDSYARCYEIFCTADRDLWPRLGGITAPTLAVTGSDDPGSTPEMSRKIAAAVPGARAVVVPGVRHLLPLQAPGELAALILEHTRSVDGERPSPHAS
ncbi:alpha/beta fold hydrolase [Actinomadura keratinilytica]|uniref:Alpha/beta fold hydrolase n=1 Tax=Actinomadura keratinilytica TaxID=547461 RepID=A0ABP7XZA2_9ACTN